MSYQTGLSGLNAASNDLDVIGNNIANANTVGFKAGQAEFSDLYANSVATAINNQIGIGAQMSSVRQDFSQGSFTTTNNPLDVAINGNGFFQVSNNGAVAYSRNGVFNLSKSGTIINSDGLPLMGFAANANGVVDTSQTIPLNLTGNLNLAPQPTANVAASFNLNAADTPPTATPFDPTNVSSYNYTTSVSVYDSEGASHDVSIYFVKSGTSGQWNSYVGSPSASTTVGANSAFTALGTLTFNTSGVLTGPGSYTFSMQPTNGSATPQTIQVNFANTTQFGEKDSVTNLNPDGNSAASLSNFAIGSDGMITGTYSNGGTQIVGQIVLAAFNNPNGLVNISNNLFEQTDQSGVAQIAAPGTTNHGSLLGGSEEASNVDLTSELVNLITAQRNYQANAQTIKTQQTIDQTIVNL